MTNLPARIVNKVKSLRADLAVLWPIAHNRRSLVPWLVASGRGFGQEDSRRGFTVGGLQVEVRGRDLLGLRELLVEDEYGFVRELLAGYERPRVVDLGANIGMFSIALLAAYPSAVVYAFEPSAATFSVLRDNCRRNAAYDWTCVRAAVTDVDGEVRFANQRFSTGSRVAEDGDERVPSVTLRTVIRQYVQDEIHLLKLDVEGSEEAILTGSADLLGGVQNVVVEIHPDRSDRTRVLDVLSHAYPNLYYVPDRRSSKPLVVASKANLTLPKMVY